MNRPAVLVGLLILAALLGAAGGVVLSDGASAEPGITQAREENGGSAEARYRDGLRQGIEDGRAAFVAGTDEYRAIWRRGYRRAKRALVAEQSEDGYAAAHTSGYNEGYEEGYEHANDGRPYDDSDNDTPGTVGDDDAGSLSGSEPSAPDPAVPEYGGGDLDCADVGSDVPVGPDDPHDLDRDGDGIGCDS